jgi:hypothetical protein
VKCPLPDFDCLNNGSFSYRGATEMLQGESKTAAQ